jgi:beta-glucosidase
MKKHRLLAALVLLIFAVSCRQPVNEPDHSWKDPEIERKVAEMVRNMTLEEKVGQMTQITLDVLMKGENVQSSFEPLEFDSAMMHTAFVKYQIGSVLNTANNRARTPQEWNRIISTIQNYAIENSRHRIPVIYGIDMIHGASYVEGATLFPQQIGMAATWNPELVRKAGEITAYETRAIGCAWTFSPVLDLGVDPRWPRVWETFGEDPYLASVMGKALVSGYQGPENNVADPYRIVACAKHFLGYSHPLSGKDRTPAWIPENKLREYHLPVFNAGIEAGAMTVMLNSGEINGLPVHASKYLITDVLKGELNFGGFVLTDWTDIEFLHTRHRIASSHKEAVKIAINAGVDMSMVPYNFYFADHLIELVNEGKVPISRINDAVTRILRVKHHMGLFERPYTLVEDYPKFASDEFAEFARQTANESITLLKNQDNILPLKRNTRILLGGPAANTMRPLNGGWSYSWQGELVDEFAVDYLTIYEALKAHASDPSLIKLNKVVTYANEGDYRNELVAGRESFLRMAAQADVIVLCIGENSYTEKPGDLVDLYLSENQQQLVRDAAATGKPVILVLAQGRPRIISKIEPLAKGIINAYLPSNFGGEAIAKVIYGEVNPSGRLPFTYPRYPNSLELYYHKYTENLRNVGAPYGTWFNPQFPFGFGLSYSSFEYSNLTTDKDEYAPGEIIRLSVDVKNTSSIGGKETVQVYSSDMYASLTPSVKRLRAFQKKNIPPGESRTFTFEIPVNELAFINLNNNWVIEQGAFVMTVGPLTKEIQVTRTLEMKSQKTR